MEMRRRTPKGIQRTQKQDHKLTSTSLPKREEKFRVEIDVLGHVIGEVLS